MKIAVCDDDFEFRKNVINYLNDYFKVENEIAEFSSAEELLEAYKNNAFYDIILLDVEMQKLSGIAAGIRIREYDKKAVIVFVSNYPKYAIPAYECEPLYFILKPLETEVFEKVMNKAVEKYKLLHSYYVITNRTEVIRIPISEILYVEIYRKHLTFHTSDRNYETTGKLCEAFNKLKMHGFCQVHQGYIVNMNRIKGFENFDVVMDNNEKIMISVRKKSEVLKIYADYLERIY